MKTLAALPVLGILLAACVSDGVAPSPLVVDLQVVSSAPSASAQSSGKAVGAPGEVAVSGTLVGDCSLALSAAGRQYGSDKLVLDLLSQPGARTCDASAGPVAFQYESVLKGIKPGVYRVEILYNSGAFPAPTQTVTVR